MKSENGVRKSNEPPTNCRPSTSKSLDEGAEHDTLRESGDRRAVAEPMIPKAAPLGVAVAELEGDAAEDQRQQHHQNGKVDGRQR